MGVSGRCDEVEYLDVGRQTQLPSRAIKLYHMYKPRNVWAMIKCTIHVIQTTVKKISWYLVLSCNPLIIYMHTEVNFRNPSAQHHQ